MNAFRTRATFLLLVVIVSPLLQAACRPGTGEIVIGVVGPSSGADASSGIRMRNGAALAAEIVNRRGGLLGREVRVVFRNDDDPASAPQRIEELVGRHAPAAVIGVRRLAAAQRSAGKIPILTMTGEGAAPGASIYRLAPSSASTASNLADWLAGREFNRVSVIAEDSAWGSAGQSALERSLGEKGIETQSQRVTSGTADFATIARAVEQKGSSAVVPWLPAHDAAKLVVALRSGGFRGQIAGPWTLFDAGYRALARGAADNTMIVFPEVREERWVGPEVRDWMLEYHRRYRRIPLIGSKSLVSDFPFEAVAAFDAVNLVATAIAEADSAEPERVDVALRKATMQGVLWEYDFRGGKDAFESDDLTPARFYNSALLYDLGPGADLDRQVAFYKIQVSAYHVPDFYLESTEGERLVDRVLEEVLTNPEDVEFFRPYAPPRPAPGPL